MKILLVTLAVLFLTTNSYAFSDYCGREDRCERFSSQLTKKDQAQHVDICFCVTCHHVNGSVPSSEVWPTVAFERFISFNHSFLTGRTVAPLLEPPTA